MFKHLCALMLIYCSDIVAVFKQLVPNQGATSSGSKFSFYFPRYCSCPAKTDILVRIWRVRRTDQSRQRSDQNRTGITWPRKPRNVPKWRRNLEYSQVDIERNHDRLVPFKNKPYLLIFVICNQTSLYINKQRRYNGSFSCYPLNYFQVDTKAGRHRLSSNSRSSKIKQSKPTWNSPHSSSQRNRRRLPFHVGQR